MTYFEWKLIKSLALASHSQTNIQFSSQTNTATKIDVIFKQTINIQFTFLQMASFRASLT